MFIDTIQTAKLLGVSTTRVRTLLKQNRVVGAYKIGRFWVIPLTDGMPVVRKGTRGPSTSFKSARSETNFCRGYLGKTTARANCTSEVSSDVHSFRKSAKSIIHINRQKVAQNHKQNKFEPVITVKCGKSNTYGHTVEINGPCRIVYSQEQTKFGARVWIETFSTVDVFCKNSIPIKKAS